MRSEFRAGRADARRTPDPHMFDGLSWGDIYYAAGYALEAIAARRRR